MIATLAIIFCMSPVIAQDEEENDGIAQIVLITPKEGHSKDLEEAITAYHKFMARKEGAWRYQWYSIITGPDTGKYIARSGSHNWEDFDAKHDWDEEAGAKFASGVQPFIADMDVSITRSDDELGIWPESMEGYQYFLITHWYVKPGSLGAYNKGIKKIDGILKEGGWPNYYAFTYTVSGGQANARTLVSPRKSFADMAPKEPTFIDAMNKAMGEEEAQAFLAEWGQTYKQGSNYMLHYRADLSDYGDNN